MERVFAGDEILQIAMELEETGQVFYEAVAAGCGNEAVARLCRRLAQQEIDHYNTFKRMREELPARSASRPLNWQELGFVQDLVNKRVIPDPAQAVSLAREGSLAKTLELAIRMENDSVKFYTELLGASEGEDAQTLKRIIAEENKHAQDLLAARRSL